MNRSKKEDSIARSVAIVFILVEGWNLIGYSSDEANLSLSSAKFYNTTSYTWASALAANKINAFLSYLDTNAQANLTKYKYLSTISGADDSAFRNKKGYWLYANQQGILTLPGVGGSTSSQEYVWSKLRFRNSSGSEMNVTDAGAAGWLTTTLQTWNQTGTGPGGNPLYDFISISSGNLNSWKGYFINSSIDNLTLIRQN